VLSWSIAVVLGAAIFMLLVKKTLAPPEIHRAPTVSEADVAPAPALEQAAKAKARKSAARNRAVDLSQEYNAAGIYTDGKAFPSYASLDGIGNAFPAQMLASAKVWDGVTFSLGPPNARDAVTSRTISLPAGKFDGLKMLAVGVNGDQESQIFRVTYSDGTSAEFSQSLSDWYTPENFKGEADVAITPYRLDGSGGRDDRTFHLYGYSFALDEKKTVRSFSLPSNTSVLVFGLALVRASSGAGASAR
jgi:hypothetical protein